MAGNYLAWSTFSNYNVLLGDNFRSSSVSSYQVDQNGDGLNDQLNITLQLPLDNSEEIVGFQLLLFFDYQLTRFEKFRKLFYFLLIMIKLNTIIYDIMFFAPQFK